MHELSIAQHLLDLVRQHVPPADHQRIRAVRLRAGPFAGVMVSSLQFCFDALVSADGPPGARLVVEPVPARTRCDACGEERAVAAPPGADGWAAWWLADPLCAACGAPRVETVGGQELELVSVELAEAVSS